MKTDTTPNTAANPQISIIKYDNRLNNLQFSGLSSLEMNVLFVAIGLLMEKGVTTVSFSFDDIARLAGIKRNKPGYINDVLSQTKQKIFNLSLNYLDKERNYDASVHIFRAMEIDGEKRLIKLLMEEQVEWLINGIKKNFTAFELRELIELKKKTAKNLFLHLKQWKTTGTLTITLKQAREMFGIPESCPDKNIMSKYLKPAIEEIVSAGKSFNGLNVTSIKTGRSHELVGYEFTWIPERIKIDSQTADNDAPETKTRKGVKFRMKDEKLTTDDYNELVSKYDSQLVNSIIDKIQVHNYKGCLNKETIEQWCEEKYEEITQLTGASYYPNDRKLEEAFIRYLEMRKRTGAALTESAISATMQQLERYSVGDNDVAIKILENATANEWHGIYPLNGQSTEESLLKKWFS